MRRNRLRLAALAAWAVAALPIASSFAQSSEPSLDKYGWWNANQTLPDDPTGGLLPPLEVPAPPDAPEDGLYVESGADGTPLAIAAVSYFTGGGVDASLTLPLAEGSSGEGATLAACPAGAGWDAAQNGKWSRRPTYDDAQCTFLGTVGDGVVTFSIPASAHEPGSSYLSLAIVPAAGSGAFAAGFDPPTSASLVTTPAPGATAEPTGAPDPAYGPQPVTFGDSAFDVPPTEAFEAPSAPQIPTSATDEVAVPSRPVATSPVAADESERSDRILAGLALALVGAGLWALAMRPQRAPRLLGSLASDATPVPAVAVVGAPAPRGLGRFVRNRTAPPTPI